MRPIPLLALLLYGCGTGGQGDDASARGEAPKVQTATLTGLYESASAPPSQLCIIERQDGDVRFGLVGRDSAGRACSGAGSAARRGAVLRLDMAGEESCAIEARIEGGLVTLPERLPEACAYYCAPGARPGGTAFVKTGGGEADAMRARDLVGDALCG